jgi:hypothetical protein
MLYEKKPDANCIFYDPIHIKHPELKSHKDKCRLVIARGWREEE